MPVILACSLVVMSEKDQVKIRGNKSEEGSFQKSSLPDKNSGLIRHVIPGILTGKKLGKKGFEGVIKAERKRARRSIKFPFFFPKLGWSGGEAVPSISQEQAGTGTLERENWLFSLLGTIGRAAGGEREGAGRLLLVDRQRPRVKHEPDK